MFEWLKRKHAEAHRQDCPCCKKSQNFMQNVQANLIEPLLADAKRQARYQELVALAQWCESYDELAEGHSFTEKETLRLVATECRRRLAL